MNKDKKRVFPEIDIKLYGLLKKLAKAEHRTVSRQFEVFIEDCLPSYMKEKGVRNA